MSKNLVHSQKTGAFIADLLNPSRYICEEEIPECSIMFRRSFIRFPNVPGCSEDLSPDIVSDELTRFDVWKGNVDGIFLLVLDKPSIQVHQIMVEGIYSRSMVWVCQLLVGVWLGCTVRGSQSMVDDVWSSCSDLWSRCMVQERQIMVEDAWSWLMFQVRGLGTP